MTRETKKTDPDLQSKQVNKEEALKQDNPSGMKETLKKTDRRNPKKGLPINSPGRESSKS